MNKFMMLEYFSSNNNEKYIFHWSLHNTIPNYNIVPTGNNNSNDEILFYELSSGKQLFA
jgi:hypothetical protein